MSDELVHQEMVQAMKQNALVNAAAVAQRERHAEEEKASRDKGTNIHFLTNALNFAVALNRSRPDRTATDVLKDAEVFLAWFNGWRHDDKAP